MIGRKIEVDDIRRRTRMPTGRFTATDIVFGLSLMGVALCNGPSVQARVTQLLISATERPAFGGKSFGDVGPYERISGRIIGEVDADDPSNANIVDISLAPKNPDGMVTYSTDFQI